MLIFPLKKEWYEKIKSGEKTIEYREVKPYWTTRFYNEFGYFPEQGPIKNWEMSVPCCLCHTLKRCEGGLLSGKSNS